MSTEIEKKETLDISAYHSIQKNNESRVVKCTDFFKKIIEDTDLILNSSDEVVMTKGLSVIEKHKSFESDANKLVKELYENRIGITQVFDVIKKQFTSQENDVKSLVSESQNKTDR